jgi:hypothetical protein
MNDRDALHTREAASMPPEYDPQGRSAMTWLVIAVVAVCGAFSGTYIFTGDIWTAAFAGGIPAMLYMTGLAGQAACKPASIRCRIAVILVTVVVLTGISAQFMVLSSRTRWQSTQLVNTRRSLDRDMLMSSLFDHASPVFVAFQRQRPTRRHTVADIFKASWDRRQWDSPQVFLDSVPESLKVYASIGARGEVVLTGMSVMTRGADSNFRNINGTTGFVQSRLYLTGEGMSYENEN